MWCIPAKSNAQFVYQTEAVLEVYMRSLDPRHPVLCMGESSEQCVKEVRPPIAARPGQTERYEVEYQRNGVAHLLLFYAHFDNWRRIRVADKHAACEWAQGVRRLVEDDYPDAERITLVMDNLATHKGAPLYKAFPPIARAVFDRLDFVYTPKHGSWLNMAECEFSVLARQCLGRRLPDRASVSREVAAWVAHRNRQTTPVNWRFSAEDARIKLKRFYRDLSN